MCIYDVLVKTKEGFLDHLKELEKLIQKLAETGLNLNAEYSFFVNIGTECLVFWVSKNRVVPLLSKLYDIELIPL